VSRRVDTSLIVLDFSSDPRPLHLTLDRPSPLGHDRPR
jgi:hypothetical protein